MRTRLDGLVPEKRGGTPDVVELSEKVMVGQQPPQTRCMTYVSSLSYPSHPSALIAIMKHKEMKLATGRIGKV